MLNVSSERSAWERLTKEVEAHGKYITITGFKGVKIEDVHILLEHIREKAKSGCVQLFDASLIASWEHLYFAAINALRAFETGLRISNDLAIETLLYASAQHQIRRAVELVGVKPSSYDIGVLIISETKTEADRTLRILSDTLQGTVSNEALELTKEKIETIRNFFNISHLEMEAASRGESPEKTLVDLVIEHMALLVVHT